jgi:hypothetical protein
MTNNKRFTLIACVFLIFLSCVGYAAERNVPPQNPELVPQRIMLSLTADPAHSQAVSWRTTDPQTGAQAQIAEASAHPDFVKSVRTVTGSAQKAEINPGTFVGVHAVTFSGLKPATSYTYRVGDGTHWSEWNTFRTASEKPEPFRFIYLGDAQNDIKSMWSRAVRAAYQTAPDARFIVHAGDLVQEGYDDSLWGEWCDAMGFIGSNVPSLPVPGNHDLHRPPASQEAKTVLSVSPLWRYHFLLPNNGPENLEELRQQSYFVDYQGVRLISLDVNVYANESFDAHEKRRIWDGQTKWLESVLRNNPNRWTVVVQHQPVYTVSKERDYEEMRRVLVPLYDKYHVDLVLQGHDHAYARSQKLFAGKPVAALQPGTVYVISVSGPKMYEATGKFSSLMAKQIHNTQLYQIIDVSGQALSYRAYSVEGRRLDEFQLHKRVGDRRPALASGKNNGVAAGR